MKGRVFIVSFFLMSLLMVLLGCGRKGPPTLPQKPSSLIRIEQKAQLPSRGAVYLELGVMARPDNAIWHLCDTICRDRTCAIWHPDHKMCPWPPGGTIIGATYLKHTGVSVIF